MTCREKPHALNPSEESSEGSEGSVGTAGHLKSGMPLGVLMPAPTMTTTLWQALARINSAMSCRDSFSFLLLPPFPRIPETPAEKAMGLLPPVILTEKGQWPGNR